MGKKKGGLHIHVEMCSVSVSFDAGLCTYLCTRTCLRAQPRACVRGRFDAFLSGPAPFALLVFNDASREADSRRVERAAFDVSDYDITDVERRSGDPRSPPLPFTSQCHIIQKERRERSTEEERGRLNIWPEPECVFVRTQNVLQIDAFCCGSV